MLYTIKYCIMDSFGEIRYEFNENEGTANVVGFRCKKKSDIIIPRSVNYNSKEYVVTKISQKAFSFSQKVKSLQFSEDSEIRIIEQKAFQLSSIEKIIIPPSLTQLDERCFYLAINLKKVIVMPNNPVYCSLYNDQIICQKSSIEKVDFDVLFYCVQNLETITIPNFIETIGAFSFESSEIKSVEFPPDSKLKLIENHAFDFSKIESIKIPPHLTKISNRSFVFCGNLHQFDIPENSELQVIDESAFQNVIIESIKIPPHLTKICRNAFNHCGNLKSIEIPYNSEQDNRRIGFCFCCN